jgi:hypothetical protein
MRLLIALLLPSVAPLTVIAINRPIVSEVTSIVTRESPGLVWGDTVYRTRDDFKQFLKSRGQSYETWAERHPGAAPWKDRAEITDALAAWALATCLALSLVTSRRSRLWAVFRIPRRLAIPESLRLQRRDPDAVGSTIAATAAGVPRAVARFMDERNLTHADIAVYVVAAGAALGAGILVAAMSART